MDVWSALHSVLTSLDAVQWALLAVAALVIGAAKTSVQNFVFFAVGVFAYVLPARESTAAVVLLLVVADALAVLRYHRLADWALLKRLLPWVIPGEVLGAVFLALVSDGLLRLLIGLLLVVLLVPQIRQIVRSDRSDSKPPPELGPAALGGVGTLAGFTTMAANASGPIFTWYLMLLRVDKSTFVGTGAVFFAIVNVLKIPAGIALGLMSPRMLAVDLLLVPIVLVGSWLGARLLKLMSQRVFDLLAVGMSVVAAVALLIPR